ncbi:MAG TPA: type II toxin-antitoxin system VapC family toxin [Acetobacteraceae bacterium]|nr:type II toxin-antitoxin system VapC family toxin [Acetobacteraceae bacterium]
MVTCVLDASITVAALIEEERSDEARGVFRAIIDGSAVVPGLWALEVGNILLILERRRVLSAIARREHLDDLSRLPIVVDHETTARAWQETMTLAERHVLTLYDAAYLELSLRRQLPLATFDEALRKAAAAVNVHVL